MHNQEEMKKILDQGMLTRSIIETEVTAKKCYMYSEMAHEREVKAFFQKQASSLDDLTDFFKSKLTEVM
ncbi:MAG: hypothetical protein AWM53_01212 [Candidatus Dichloromethanomonas elyunquensis]|nr:MAG: hypothetical protein AWM53_01212 [Candidatus Dichloromethanomonas elyunquensis]